MLKTRVIPMLLWKGSVIVKGEGFDSWRTVGTLLPAIKVYNRRLVDELIVVDIAGTAEGRLPDLAEVRHFSSECFVPLALGGGIHEMDHVREILRAGADKVVINSAAYRNPEFIRSVARSFGSQCVVVSIDARRKGSSYECYSHSGKEATGWEPEEWAREMETRGAGEILVTSVEQDGTLRGYDFELVLKVSRAVHIPVIAGGGAGTYEDMRKAIQECGASAVAAGAMFLFTEQTPLEAKKYLHAAGIQVRLV